MPRIISYTPAWLSRPSPGFHLFSNSTLNEQEHARKPSNERNGKRNSTYVGPKRTIARRGTEVFVVVDNQIRWSDLCMLKDKWDEQQELDKRKRNAKANGESYGFHKIADDLAERFYRVLKFPGSEQIQQLSISPNGSLLAILTSHTVHVAIVPDSSHLDLTDHNPLKLKAYTIGPTTHVLSQSPVVRALWHPCGVAGNCLVTITADAGVRLWELNIGNRGSFDGPSLAIDLKKLVLGASDEDDFVPSRIGRNKGFSSDMVGMEVASACFGGTGSAEESPWSAATLWIAMKDGDVYALCPLLPSKWLPSATLIPSLSTSAISDNTTSEDEIERFKRDQYRWISDLDRQEPTMIPGDTELAPFKEVYNRPSHPGPIPKLQGPFQIYPDDLEEDLELSDILLIAAKADIEELMSGEDLDSDFDILDEGGLSRSIVCLLTKSGRVHICLDLDGVEGEWLPHGKSTETLIPKDLSLVPFEALDTLANDHIHDDEWPTFSADVLSRHSFFVTHSQGVYFFSLEPWLQGLENEFQNDSIAGASFRIKVMKNGPGTLRERILNFEKNSGYNSASASTACVLFQDSDIGYFLLASAGGQPQAALLDQPNQDLLELSTLNDDYDYKSEKSTLALAPTRSIYQPPDSFWTKSSLPTFVNKYVPSRHKKIMNDQIRLSPATLELMTESHRILSEETQQLGIAVADLFRWCERLQDELHEQIQRVNEAADKVDGTIENREDHEVDGEYSKGDAGIEQRFRDTITRQHELADRHKELRRKIAKFGSKQLSEKEEQWVSEIGKMGGLLLASEMKEDDDDEQPLKPWQRYNEIKKLEDELVPRAKQIEEERSQGKNKDNYNKAFSISHDIRKAKVEHAQGLLEKETMLLNTTMSRFQRLTIPSIS